MRSLLLAAALGLAAPSTVFADPPDYTNLVGVYMSSLQSDAPTEHRDYRHLWALGAQHILGGAPCEGGAVFALLHLGITAGQQGTTAPPTFGFACITDDDTRRHVFRGQDVIDLLPLTEERALQACRTDWLRTSAGYVDAAAPGADVSFRWMQSMAHLTLTTSLPSLEGPLTITGNCAVHPDYTTGSVQLTVAGGS